jgi:hypothetical protein
VARSMPTSGAVDLVAARLNLNLFETPTGMSHASCRPCVCVYWCGIQHLFACL